MWHLIALRTVVPSLKSAREHCKDVQPPRFMVSGELNDCVNGLNNVSAVLNGTGSAENMFRTPLHITPDWTYWIIKDAS